MKPSFKSCSIFLLFAAALSLCCAPPKVHSTDWPQWRGPNRDGISQEKGLLKEWAGEGPKLLWKIEDAGSGYSTPAVQPKHSQAMEKAWAFPVVADGKLFIRDHGTWWCYSIKL